MTKEELQMLEVLKVFSEGGEIQAYIKDEWVDVNTLYPAVLAERKLRVKPKFRPYSNAEEFLVAQEEHGLYFKLPSGAYQLADSVNDKGVHSCSGYISYADLCECYLWQDKKPCGILE